MIKHCTVEKIVARDAYTWCSDDGSNHSFDVTLYLKSHRSPRFEGVVLGYETTDWEDEPLGYCMDEISETEIPIFEVHSTTMGTFKREVHRASSRLEAYLECVRRARASLELVNDELSALTFGTVLAEDRLRQEA